MKCISRNRIISSVLTVILCISLCGCGKSSLICKYPTVELDNEFFNTSANSNIKGFADDLCVASGDVITEGMEPLSSTAALFSLDDNKVIYANKMFDKMYPASITKILTALVFFENYKGDYTETLTASSVVNINEPGAQECGFAEGDQIPIDVVLHGLLIYSGNDAANMIAEYIGGSVDNFVTMMNDTAKRLGATGSNFVNPHGLSDDNHYTTAYDLYLIFNEVMKYDKFIELISQKEYTGEYTRASNTTRTVKWQSTNLYFTGDKEIPEGITVIGGKTGTTKAAGSCLILLSQNSQGKKFISVVMKADDKAALYSQMSQLLTLEASN